jgi:hypothetical protein
MDLFIITLAILSAGWMLRPPRGDTRAWLALSLLTLWLGLMAVGLYRGILSGFEGWLALLALMAALAALLVLWSLVNLR